MSAGQRDVSCAPMRRPSPLPPERGQVGDVFFESDARRVLAPALQSVGEVPATFRENSIVLCVAARRPPRARRPPLAATTFHATFTVSVLGHEPFNPTCDCLLVDDTVLVAKAVMRPLDIHGSQFIARTTIISAEVFQGRRRVATARSPLSALLWEDKDVVRTEPLRRAHSLRSFRALKTTLSAIAAPAAGEGRLFVETRRGRQSSDLVELRVDVSRRLQLATLGKHLVFSLARADGRGSWRIFYRKNLAAARDARAPLRFSRDFLFGPGGGLARPLRFSLHEARSTFDCGSIGHSELSFAKLVAHELGFPFSAVFCQEPCSTPVALLVRSVLQRDDGFLELDLLFVHGRQVKKLTSSAR
jgi:hypothetical protein